MKRVLIAILLVGVSFGLVGCESFKSDDELTQAEKTEHDQKEMMAILSENLKPMYKERGIKMPKDPKTVSELLEPLTSTDNMRPIR